MTNAELIAKIKAEIKRQISDLPDTWSGSPAAKWAFEAILSSLDTLESEHLADARKTSPKDLEEAAEEATIKEGILAGPNFEVAVRTFKAGVKWRDSHFPKLPDDLDIAARKSAIASFNYDFDEEHLYEYPYLPIAEQKFKEGAKWDREQMMSEAVEGVVCYGSKGAYIETDFLGEYNTDVYGNPGDKVRIIVVKED